MAHTYAFTVTTPAAAGTVTGNHRAFVSLLSDFGARDASAGIMRAVVAGINPAASIVDLAHEVDKFAIRDGALLLWSAVPYLPIGAHVAVVDPGVGTDRKGIAVETARGDFLVGPFPVRGSEYSDVVADADTRCVGLGLEHDAVVDRTDLDAVFPVGRLPAVEIDVRVHVHVYLLHW